jgi:molybdate transport system regulatory protein
MLVFRGDTAMAAEIDIKARVITRGAKAFGPGPADLLEKIDSEGSISKAAKAMDMSYSRAWQLVERINTAFVRPLVVSSTGGKHGGGAVLTEDGRQVLALYREMEAALEAKLDAFLPEFEKRLK